DSTVASPSFLTRLPNPTTPKMLLICVTPWGARFTLVVPRRTGPSNSRIVAVTAFPLGLYTPTFVRESPLTRLVSTVTAPASVGARPGMNMPTNPPPPAGERSRDETTSAPRGPALLNSTPPPPAPPRHARAREGAPRGGAAPLRFPRRELKGLRGAVEAVHRRHRQHVRVGRVEHPDVRYERHPAGADDRRNGRQRHGLREENRRQEKGQEAESRDPSAARFRNHDDRIYVGEGREHSRFSSP